MEVQHRLQIPVIRCGNRCCKSVMKKKKSLFVWFQDHSTGGYVIDFMDDYLSDFLMNEFHDRELLQ